LAGCAGVGVVATSDPTRKLQDAEVLFGSEDRPLIAERLIREALEISEQQQDEFGVANAYRTYGFFFRSPSVSGHWGEYYRKSGFLESSVAWEDRFSGSIQFFQKAVEIYDRLGRYDASTNINLNMGFTYFIMHDKSNGCQAFTKSLDSYHANLKVNPAAKPQAPPGYSSFEEYVRYLETQQKCLAPEDNHA
jgi:hypothetical protein